MLSILTVLKTILYINLTNINHDRILILLITSLITISWLSLINKLKFSDGKKNVIKLILYSILSFIIFSDTIYYLQFNMLPSVKLLGQVKLLSSVTEAIYTILNWKNLLLIIDLPLLFIYYILKKENKFELDYKYPLLSLIVVLIFTITTGKSKAIKSQELYTYHIIDIINSNKSNEIPKIEQNDIEDLKERAKLKQGKYTGIGKGKNLIVVQVEALQNFVVGLEYNGVEITPNINKLIKEQGSLYYDRYYQLVGRGNTSDAEFVSNNSLHPAMDEPSYTRYEKNDFYGLPKLLKDQNYEIFAMHGYKPEFWNRKNAYVNQGYETFLDENFYMGEEVIGMGVSDRAFFRKNIEFLKNFKDKNDSPFYSFMVTLTSHTPFKMDREYQVIDLEEKYINTMTGDYLQSIHYTDRQIGYLMQILKENDLYKDTVLAIYGDHFAIKASNEEESKLMTDLLNYKYDYDTMMNIPLIIHIPNLEENQTISKVGSQIDFFPTIQNIMGYDNEKSLIFGRDLNNYKGENTVKPQTYMKKGSFIKEDITFEIARDGIFEHSRAYNIDTKEPVDIKKCEDYYKEAIREINIADYIEGNNLLKEYIETGQITLKDKKNEEKTYIDYTNDIKDIKNVTIKIDVDSQDLDFENIFAYGNKNNIEFILSGNIEKLINLYDNYKLDDAIVRITDIEDYILLTNRRYKRVLLDPYEKKYKKKHIENFISTYPDLYLELKKRDIKKYKDNNLVIYTKTK